MIVRVLAAGLVAAGMMSAAPAFAEPEGDDADGGTGLYVEGNAGLVKLGAGKGTDRHPGNGTPADPATTTHFSVDYERSPFYSGAVGYASKACRLEVEYRALASKISEPGASSFGADEIKAKTTFVNLWFPFDKVWGVHPYVGGGVGMIQRSVPGAKDSTVAVQVGLGADWQFANHWALTSAYRYLDTTEMKFTRGTDTVSTTYSGQLLSLGLRYNIFYTAPALPPPAPVQVVPPIAPPDSDGDGVPDDLDHCPDTPAGTPVDASGCPLPPAAPPEPQCKTPEPGERVSLAGCGTGDKIVLRGVTFEFDKSRLTVDARTLLDDVAAELTAYPDVRVEIGGHTDGRGSETYNQPLSEKRAESVRTYLIGKGVDESRMTAVGYGMSQPIDTNDTDDGRSRNRRVELKIIADTGAAAATSAPAPAPEPAPEELPKPAP